MQGVSITASALGQANKALVTSSFFRALPPGLRLAVLDSENFRMYKYRTKLAVQSRKRPIK